MRQPSGPAETKNLAFEPPAQQSSPITSAFAQKAPSFAQLAALKRADLPAPRHNLGRRCRTRIATYDAPREPELVRTTIGGNGTTLELQGRLIVRERGGRRLTRIGPVGKVESLVDNYKGGRCRRPNA